MNRIFVLMLFLTKILNAQTISNPRHVEIIVPDSGSVEINQFILSNHAVTLKTLDSIFQARHVRSSFTRDRLAYFIYPKYKLRIFCFVGDTEKYPALILIPFQFRNTSKVTLEINGVSMSGGLTFDDIYYNPYFQSMIVKSYYENPEKPNKYFMIMRNSNNIYLYLSFKRAFLDFVEVDVNSSIGD